MAAVFAAFKRVRSAMVAHLAPRWLELNLTMAQVHVLHVVRRHGRMSGRQLAGALHVSPAAVVPVCDRLEQQGYIERVRDQADRRILWLQLTASGVELLDGFSGGGMARVVDALRRLPDGDVEDLARSLDALATVLEADQETGQADPSPAGAPDPG